MSKTIVDTREDKYLEYIELCKELGYPTTEMYLSRKIMVDGNILVDKAGRAHSWTRNAFNIMLSQFASKDIDDVTYGAGLVSLKRTEDTVFYLNSTVNTYTYSSAAGNTDYGIVVGSNNTGFAFDDNKMWVLIAHGESSGQLSYSTTNSSSAFTDGNTKFTTTLTRYLNNNSGGDVTINEIGLVAGLHWYSSGGQSYPPTYATESLRRLVLVCRDVLSEPDVLPDAMQYLVTYTMTLTYPE